MTADVVRNPILILATITTGFTAGVFADWSNAIMTAWNTVRAAASTIAFGCLAWAVAIHRRQLD